MARLQDKVALITGGESGIGLATAKLFVSEGASVHLIGIDQNKLSAADELGHDKAFSSAADVTDEDAVRRAVADGVDRYGRFDVVVSNAGISGAVAGIVDYPSHTHDPPRPDLH
jgi:NAD(P)-dependent dehydrogenase (short-subunit alcohol dehydrogenase family)